MDFNFTEIRKETEKTILYLLKSEEENEELYVSLHALSDTLGELTGSCPPNLTRDDHSLLTLYSWVTDCCRQLEKGDFSATPDVIFQKIVDTVDNHSAQELEQIISKNFFSLSNEDQKGYSDYLQTYQFWGQIDADTGKGTMVQERAACLKEHIDDFIWLYNRLGDYRSKYVLAAILKHWLTFNIPGLDAIIEKLYPSYFDLDILPYSPNEVFVDLGAYVGDSIVDFVNSYRSYHKIFGYEIDKANLEIAKKNLQKLPNVDLRYKAASDTNGTLEMAINVEEGSNSQIATNKARDAKYKNVQVPCVTLDTDIQEPITLLKMDIEGGEQAALRGAQRHICSEKPKLAICTYHGNTPLWEIPRIIDGMRNDYKFYMRYNGGTRVLSEYVLICV